MKRIGIILVLIMSMISSLPVYATEIDEEIIENESISEESESQINDETDENDLSQFIEFEEEITDIDGFEDDDALFSQYVEKTMYNSGISLFSISDYLLDIDDPKYPIYSNWKSLITQVACGEITNTELTIYDDSNNPISIPTTDINMNRYNSSTGVQYSATACLVYELLSYLQVDCPYELYWFDKVAGAGLSGIYSVSGDTLTIKKLTVKMAVNIEYAKTPERKTYLADDTKTGATLKALENAQSILLEASELEDEEKLKYYADAICDLVAYDYSAPGSNTYGNPWQMIWVFDQDTSTNVVCEGYSKAFEYLCDNSIFESEMINCLTVWGRTNGNHMWNLVTMEDGKNYLVDLTNYDSARNTRFFLGYVSDGSIESGYRLNGTSTRYYYDEAIKSYFGSYLIVSNTPYKQESEEIIQPESIVLSHEIMNLQVGLGKMKLDVKLLPEDTTETTLTFISSNPSVATIDSNGIITPLKKGKTKITVSTSNHLSATCLVNVDDTISYSIKDGVLRIEGVGNIYDWDDGKDVPWNNQVDTIHTVIIEDGITSLGNHTFDAFTSLERVYFGKSIENAGINTFPYDVTYYLDENSYMDTVLNDHEKIYIQPVLLDGYSVTLDGSIGLNFYLTPQKIDYYDARARVEIEYPDGRNEIQYLNGKDPIFKAKVSAKDCTKDIKVTYINSFNVKQTFTYSVQEYANYILENHEKESFEYNVVLSLLTYARYAQLYFNYNIENLPSPYLENLEDVECGPYTIQDDNSKIDFIGARLQCASTLNLKLYFIGDETLKWNDEEIESTKEGNYTVLTIPVHNINQVNQITAQDFILEYNGYNYMHQAKTSKSPYIMDLMKSLIHYYQYF